MKHVFVVAMALAFLLNRIVAQTTVTIQPSNQVVLANSTNTVFNAEVSDTGFYSYQWYFNGTNLPNANIITTVAGVGRPGILGNGGAATNAYLDNPFGVAADSIGNFFIADSQIHRIRKVDTNGIISTIAGILSSFGNFGYSGDGGPATNAKLWFPSGVAVDKWGNVYIADIGNARIRRVNTNGIITTIAGNGTNGFYGDGGPATNAEIHGLVGEPYGMCVDTAGDLYFADYDNNRIREVDPSGNISTVANGDYGAVVTAAVIDTMGNLYFSDDIRVFKLDTNQVLTVFAGGGTNLMDGVLATNAQIFCSGLAMDTNGNLFIAEVGSASRRDVRKVDTNGIITTVAGKGLWGYSGDGGPATNASLFCPFGVALDADGNLLIVDEAASVVRKVWLTGWRALTFDTLSPGLAGNYQVVATSSSGSITSSVANLSIVYPPVSGTFSGDYFSLSCPVFQPSVLQVQWATNLTSATWSNIDVINWPQASNTTIVRNYPATNFPAGFYRVSWLQ